MAALASQRMQQPLSAWDPVVVLFVAGLWLLQEWVVHRHLLHSSWSWYGKAMHEAHHHAPYYHVSIDPAPLVLAVMALACALFSAALGGPTAPLALSASLTYIAMGVTYEWVHFVVHTRWVPRRRGRLFDWLRGVRRHHMLHHCRNEDHWLAFTLPQVDALFGTLPCSPDAVPLTDLARGPRAAAAGAVAPAHS